jgi:non-specific serine/threonine protein kinase
VLGERAQLSVATVANVERGRSAAPRPRTVLVLADALGLAPTQRAALIAAATRGSKANEVQLEGAPMMAAPPQVRHNLPPPLTSFVGRERDLAEVRRSLFEARLVTLTGPGGVGKTRLALEVAGQLARSGDPRYAAGIWRVELAPLADGAQLLRAVASVLGIQEVPTQPLLESVLKWLRARQVLLILDNCEHLVASCGVTASALLEACPGLTILATSREALNVAGELIRPLGPLEADTEGLEMFAGLAALASPAFRLTLDTRSAIIRVCERLDGLPLAIELAAARVTALSVEEIEQRLDQRFALLTAGRCTSPPRHQTLRALVDWSYELLTDAEQSLFQQLTVFSGGWTLEAAEAVCEPAADVLALLLSLVDKSLVQVEQQPGHSRYRLLETLRQFGLDKLREVHAEHGAQTRHLRWCERVGRVAERELHGPRHKEWFLRLEAEMDNFRAALAWSLLESAELDAGLHLAASLARSSFWNGGHGAEGSEWLVTLLARATVGAARADALAELGHLLTMRGDLGKARPVLEEAVAIARQLNDRCLLGISLNHLSLLRYQEGDLTGTHSALEESLALTAERTDCAQYWPRSHSINLLGELTELEGDWDGALSVYERSLELARADQDGWRTVILRCLGRLTLKRGDLVAARARLSEAIVVAEEWGSSAWGVAPALVHLASLELAEDRPERALRLAGAATGQREKHRSRFQPTDATTLEAVIRQARNALGQAAAESAWAAGEAMTTDQAVAYALSGASTQPVEAGAVSTNLTPREIEVARHLTAFATNREIAAQLVISERTAKRHVENILMKLGLRSREQVADWANVNGLSTTE